MITYDLMLVKQRLTGADRFSIAANANETVCLRFHFDCNWRRFDSKAAVFKNSDSKYYIIEILDNRAKVPWEVLTKKGEFELSVIGFEKQKVITSDKVEILVSESLLPEDYKTFSPSEELFDRFKKECTAQAYLDYKDEITALKNAHTAEKMQLGTQINEANERTLAVIAEKDREIETLNSEHDSQLLELNRTIAALENTVNEYSQKAEWWDMIDLAISMKTSPNYALWAGGTQEFELPMLNTSSITAFSTNNFSTYLTSVGLDLSSVTSFSSVFSSKNGIRKLELKNAGKVSTFANLFESCKTISEVTIDSVKGCGVFTRFANEASLLQKVSFGDTLEAGNYERAFCNCLVLREIDGLIDLGFANSANMMFTNCASLETVRFVKDSIILSIDFAGCVNLSKESLVNIFNGLCPDVSRTLTVSTYAFENNFTVDERDEWISFVTEDKGWALSLV